MKVVGVLWCCILLPANLFADSIDGEPALGAPESRITQEELEADLDLEQVRLAGLKVFVTPFNHADGFGDGPINTSDTTRPGGRPTLAANGTFLRVNGLDAQTCLECHSTVSTATVPFTFGVGGSGGMNNSPIFQATYIDVADSASNGFADMDGRLINPPALFGTGGVQLVAKEMTEALQRLKSEALERPGRRVQLRTKGVSFGYIIADRDGHIDTSNVVGIDDDLVVRPFGRKGEFPSVRSFDQDAMMFHFGMQPAEVVGNGIDADGDGVRDEIRIGEMSALEIFITTQERPVQLPMDHDAQRGFDLFNRIGCADCHRPALQTRDAAIEYAFPEVADDPSRNVFYSVDLSLAPAGFDLHSGGGLVVPMFSDLKRHDMGEELAESFQGATDQRNREFITAKLWGVADTAPYLHDGRALTLREAITLHGGEAQGARQKFEELSDIATQRVIGFLSTLRNPPNPNADVL